MPRILVTNDDGVHSPGLRAAAAALLPLGEVIIAAPREQSSGAGRSLPPTSDGLIQVRSLNLNGVTCSVYAIGGSPAQAVLHALVEILEAPPDLVVSGINYGENLGSGVTISGTVGAALEAASFGIPALAVSLETDKAHHLSYSQTVDFRAAAYFTRYFAARVLGRALPPDVYALKIDVPSDATPDTPWRLTRQAVKRYYRPLPPKRRSWDEPGTVGYAPGDPPETFPSDSDVYVVRVLRQVSVTPLSLDLTSRTPFSEIVSWLDAASTPETEHQP